MKDAVDLTMVIMFLPLPYHHCPGSHVGHVIAHTLTGQESGGGGGGGIEKGGVRGEGWETDKRVEKGVRGGEGAGDAVDSRIVITFLPLPYHHCPGSRIAHVIAHTLTDHGGWGKRREGWGGGE